MTQIMHGKTVIETFLSCEKVALFFSRFLPLAGPLGQKGGLLEGLLELNLLSYHIPGVIHSCFPHKIPV